MRWIISRHNICRRLTYYKQKKYIKYIYIYIYIYLFYLIFYSNDIGGVLGQKVLEIKNTNFRSTDTFYSTKKRLLPAGRKPELTNISLPEPLSTTQYQTFIYVF